MSSPPSGDSPFPALRQLGGVISGETESECMDWLNNEEGKVG